MTSIMAAVQWCDVMENLGPCYSCGCGLTHKTFPNIVSDKLNCSAVVLTLGLKNLHILRHYKINYVNNQHWSWWRPCSEMIPQRPDTIRWCNPTATYDANDLNTTNSTSGSILQCLSYKAQTVNGQQVYVKCLCWTTTYWATLQLISLICDQNSESSWAFSKIHQCGWIKNKIQQQQNGC